MTVVPFSITGSGRKARNIDEVFQRITACDIKEPVARTRHNTVSGSDGVQRKYITG